MSKNLSAAASKQFDTEVKHAYQALTARLAGTTTERKGVVGNEYDFRKMGKGLATQRTAPSSDAVPMNVDHALVTCTLTDWEANEYTDIFNSKEVNFDEVRELASTIAGALGRRDDQLKIDAMDGGTYSTTPVQGTSGGQVAVAVGGADTNMNIDKLRAAAKFLDDNEVPEMGRHIVATPSQKAALLAQTQVTSTDYANVKALVNGEIDTFLGFKFHWIGKRDEGGLTIDGNNVRSCYAWHESAIGYANGMDMTTNVDWIAHKKSWLSAGNLKAGAVIRDIDGIVEILCDEDDDDGAAA